MQLRAVCSEHHGQVNMAETLEFNDIFQEVKGSMVRITWAFNKGREGKEFLSY